MVINTVCSNNSSTSLATMYLYYICLYLWVFNIKVNAEVPGSLGSIRLFRNGVGDTNQSWSSGIVQIYSANEWGNICDDSSFGSDEADVICHQLGYTGASSYSNTGITTIWGVDNSTTHVRSISCSYSTYLTLAQCTFSTSSSSSCNNSKDAIVTCYPTRIWSSPVAGDIRLIGGAYSNLGLLEVYCNGQWGTVCGKHFGLTEARIACKQLGYNTQEEYNHLSQQGTSSQYIWLNTTTTCHSSTDNCLTSCGSCPLVANSSCSHSEDATLECEYASVFNYFPESTVRTTDTCISYNEQGSSSSVGTIRLVRNGVADTTQSWSSGIVEIYYDDKWGNICDDSSFGSDEADVICHQLGYTGASSYSNTGLTKTWGVDQSLTNVNDVHCATTSYLTLTQCSFSTSISSSCDDNNDVIVTCNSIKLWDSPMPGDIRLTGGTYSNQGLLEIYCSEWGTVCDDYFFSTEAQVACRQLGYNSYVDFTHLPLKGTYSQYIWFKAIGTSCSSSDTCLTKCSSNPCPQGGISTCSHSEDVTLECEYYPELPKVSSVVSSTTRCYNGSLNDSADQSITSVAIYVTMAGIVMLAVASLLVVAYVLRFRCSFKHPSNRPLAPRPIINYQTPVGYMYTSSPNAQTSTDIARREFILQPTYMYTQPAQFYTDPTIMNGNDGVDTTSLQNSDNQDCGSFCGSSGSI